MSSLNEIMDVRLVTHFSICRQTPLTCSGHTRPVVDLAFSDLTPHGYFLISACKGKIWMLLTMCCPSEEEAFTNLDLGLKRNYDDRDRDLFIAESCHFTIVMYGESSGNWTKNPCRQVPYITGGSPTGCRVSTASGNQGKLKGTFPVREKSGNLAIF